MSNPPEPWTPHPSGREESGDFDVDPDSRGRLALAFGLGAVVGVVASALLSADEDRERGLVTRVVKPLRIIRPKVSRPKTRPAEPPIRLSEVAKEEAAELIRGLFREVGGTLTHWVLDYVSRPARRRDVEEVLQPDPPGSPPGSTSPPETGST